MIVSGWIASLSVDTSVVYNDYIAETAQPNGSGTDVFAMIALSTYQQGEGGSVDGDAAAYIRAYGTTATPYVDVPGDPANNAYYVYGSTFVMFRLTVEFAYAYAHATTLPLAGFAAQEAHLHRAFELRAPDGRQLSRARFGLRAAGSTLDVDGMLRHLAAHAAAHHGLPQEAVTPHEVTDQPPVPPRRRGWP